MIGEILPVSSKIQKYILVGIYYFTKWIEAIPLVNETIITHQGSIVTGQKMQEFASDMGIKLLTSTPYYVQANGQVETTNKVIIG